MRFTTKKNFIGGKSKKNKGKKNKKRPTKKILRKGHVGLSLAREEITQEELLHAD